MTSPARQPEPDTHEIVVDEVFPHTPQVVWKALTNGALMARWLMAPTDFAPVEGHRFTFQTTPAGDWDGVIHCQVLEVRENERFTYAWTGGHEANSGYGSRLETVVTWTVTKVEGGVRVRLTHAGFTPRNEVAFEKMSVGWPKVVAKVGELSGEHDA
jgi:uncharacterized protein YndB with AHSA1/START domain